MSVQRCFVDLLFDGVHDGADDFHARELAAEANPAAARLSLLRGTLPSTGQARLCFSPEADAGGNCVRSGVRSARDNNLE